VWSTRSPTTTAAAAGPSSSRPTPLRTSTTPLRTSTTLVESFELYPTDDPYYWWSDWLGSTTYLDPFWGGYSVDIVAYDTYEDFGYATVWAETY
jgi:hypothetical protein